MKKGRTITSYLINGNPDGLRTVFVSNKTCKVSVIPRTDIDQMKDREESLRPSLYFLFNDGDNKIYIGESESFYERLKQHHSSKEFWTVAIQFFSQNENLTKANIKYLEHLSLKEISSIKNVNLEENKQKSSCPHLPEHLRAEADEFFEDVKLITSFLGYNFFKKIEISQEKDYFFCKRAGVSAKGVYKDGNFILLQGSKIRKHTKVNYFGGKDDYKDKDKINSLNVLREEFLINNYTVIDDDFISTTKDFTFNSPSGAACFAICSSANGWTEWKDEKGKTLDEVIRAKL